MIPQPYAALIATAAIAAAVAGVWLHGRNAGDTAGAARVQALWDEERLEAEAVLDEVRSKAFESAVDYEDTIAKLERRNAAAATRAEAALRAPVACPQSGEIGDVVLPAAVLDSMFHHASPEDASPAGSAASEPDASLR